MKLLIAGDTVPTKSNYSLFRTGNVLQIIGEELLSFIQEHDYFVLNLETPLIREKTPIQKSGPVLGVDQEAIRGYVEMHVNAVSLANNHIFDHGAKGFESTISVLDHNKISHFGAGTSVKEASECHYVTCNGIRIGLFSCCENEFSTLYPESGCANGYDPLETFDEIKMYAQECDYLIVLYHGGKEEYRYPTPLQRRIMRKMADCGAALVIAQHSHCIGCQEKYNGVNLIYGQGNFIFDEGTNSCWDNGLLFSIEINQSLFDVRAIPITRIREGIRIASAPVAQEILSAYEKRSVEILEHGFLEDRFEKKVRSEQVQLLRRMHGDTFCTKVFSKLFPTYLSKHFYYGSKKLAALNLIRCESHHETLAELLKMR